MNLYYAIGSGLGHLTRACAFLKQLGIEKETAILTASEFAEDKRVVGEIEIVKLDHSLAKNNQKLRKFFQELIDRTDPEKLFLDAFPFGIRNEFEGFEFGRIELIYIARLLRTENYSLTSGKLTKKFSKTYVLEDLSDIHLKFIAESTNELINFELEYENKSDHFDVSDLVKKCAPFWAVVHAGSASETSELIAYANEIREIENADIELIVISPKRIAFPNAFDIYPAALVFPFAEKIFTACGFNSIRQTEKFREKHLFLPFERRFDDQFARAGFINENRGVKETLDPSDTD